MGIYSKYTNAFLYNNTRDTMYLIFHKSVSDNLTCVVSVSEDYRMLWDVGYIVQVRSHIFLVPDNTISAFQGCRRCQNPLNNDY